MGKIANLLTGLENAKYQFGPLLNIVKRSSTSIVAKISNFMGGSPGLVVMGGDSCSKSHGFKSWHCILNGHFSHGICCKIVVLFV